jgi:carbon-monoxide dehydrogenase large subunit
LENDRCLRRSWPVHGQNGIGEGGAIGPLAAIANAVNDALASLGVEVGTLPMTPVQ